MKRLALVALFGLVSLGSAAETYTIKLKKRDKGDLLAIETEEKGTTTFTVVGPDGKEIDKQGSNSVTVAKYREAVMEKEAGKRPNKLKRTYDQAKAGDTTLSYQGKTVVIQLVGNAFQFTVDGKELKGDDLAGLTKEFSDVTKSGDDNEKFLLPTKPVAVGESWQPNLKEAFHSAFGAEAATLFDLNKATASGKLTKVYTKDKLTFGIINVELSAPIKILPGNNMPCEDGSKFTLAMTLDVCIDGTQETGALRAEMKLSGSAKIMNNGKETGNILKFEIGAVTTDSKLQYTP